MGFQKSYITVFISWGLGIINLFVFQGEARQTYGKALRFNSQGSMRDSFISETHIKNNWL